ncbi:predicted protein [Meyerozyma guilliermondii ATCC 6260]|uniref:Uncharacterized protein n=1 Tax=Meyerozyma guilliermondii (strain ATCC 6260 / CBS 566 / DSM 6381 / JCM 1539 / NBRC 10279 / NRRL Y-324) TaxID=294746 RepID=A5DMV3_PICGU|nr:uncharacterized protein PGUG_04604 [Meyerozyma guilliermondii ATCC 6260]EDK40506.2 predicted protein [Meyerozyma guilliermondii ATCC 6260]
MILSRLAFLTILFLSCLCDNATEQVTRQAIREQIMPCLENTSTEAVVNYYANSVFIYLKNDESFSPNSTHKELADCLHNRTAPASVQVIDGPISESSKYYNIVGQGERDNSFDYESDDATDSTGASSDYSTDLNQGMVAIGDESNGVMRPISNYKRDIPYATFHSIGDCGGVIKKSGTFKYIYQSVLPNANSIVHWSIFWLRILNINSNFRECSTEFVIR